MPQLHFYVPENVAKDLRRRAHRRGVPLSRFIAEVVRKDSDKGWPPGYFERVIGGWKGDPPVRPPQGDFDRREEL
jgi:hypothetical protein